MSHCQLDGNVSPLEGPRPRAESSPIPKPCNLPLALPNQKEKPAVLQAGEAAAERGVRWEAAPHRCAQHGAHTGGFTSSMKSRLFPSHPQTPHCQQEGIHPPQAGSPEFILATKVRPHAPGVLQLKTSASEIPPDSF